MIERKVLVVNGMTGRETPVRVAEGATAAELVRQMGLPDHQLARVRDRRVLAPEGDVTHAVEEGERLFVFSQIRVGAHHGHSC